jgi:hypothetical protein
MARRPSRRLGIHERIARFVRKLFGSPDSLGDWDDAEGGVGVREPRRPLAPTLSGAAALELPADDSDDAT